MLRLAFDFIITWRETRTRPNAYHHFDTVAGSLPSCSANHLLVRFFSTSTTLIRFISFIVSILVMIISIYCKCNELVSIKHYSNKVISYKHCELHQYLCEILTFLLFIDNKNE